MVRRARGGATPGSREDAKHRSETRRGLRRRRALRAAIRLRGGASIRVGFGLASRQVDVRGPTPPHEHSPTGAQNPPRRTVPRPASRLIAGSSRLRVKNGGRNRPEVRKSRRRPDVRKSSRTPVVRPSYRKAARSAFTAAVTSSADMTARMTAAPAAPVPAIPATLPASTPPIPTTGTSTASTTARRPSGPIRSSWRPSFEGVPKTAPQPM